MQVQIKFKRTGSNSVYGSFSAGDVIRCDQALAEHYVKEGVARYMHPAVAEAVAAPEVAAPEVKTRKARK